jgi:hypothetical protein
MSTPFNTRRIALVLWLAVGLLSAVPAAAHAAATQAADDEVPPRVVLERSRLSDPEEVIPKRRSAPATCVRRAS